MTEAGQLKSGYNQRKEEISRAEMQSPKEGEEEEEALQIAYVRRCPFWSQFLRTYNDTPFPLDGNKIEQNVYTMEYKRINWLLLGIRMAATDSYA